MNDANRDKPAPAEEPEMVPSISSEQPPIAAGVGIGAYVGGTEEDEAADNDQQRHVSPVDNDGETVAGDEVADQLGG